MKILDYSDFLKVDIRVGTIVKAEENHKLKNPSIILEIDFGKDIGIKKSSAQLLANYNVNNLLKKQIAAVINFEPKQIGNTMSEVLVLGFPDSDNQPILISPDHKVKNGGRLYWIYKGKLIVVFKPPSFDFDNLISPPWALIISLAIVIPKPLSPFNLFLEGSNVKNGLNTFS